MALKDYVEVNIIIKVYGIERLSGGQIKVQGTASEWS